MDFVICCYGITINYPFLIFLVCNLGISTILSNNKYKKIFA